MWRRWGTPQDFCLTFIDELENQLFNFIYFSFILHLCTKNLDDMIYSTGDIERGRLKMEILGHFLPFYPP